MKAGMNSIMIYHDNFNPQCIVTLTKIVTYNTPALDDALLLKHLIAKGLKVQGIW